MQPDFRPGLTFTLSLIALVVVPLLFLYVIFGDAWKSRRKFIEDLHKKQRTVPAAARQSLEKHIQACRDSLAGKPKSDLAALDEL